MSSTTTLTQTTSGTKLFYEYSGPAKGLQFIVRHEPIEKPDNWGKSAPVAINTYSSNRTQEHFRQLARARLEKFVKTEFNDRTSSS
jgi:hypothetical protein